MLVTVSIVSYYYISHDGFDHTKKTTKKMKKTNMTPNIFNMSQRLEVMPLKYLRSSVCAASTFVRVSSTLSSILQTTGKRKVGRG